MTDTSKDNNSGADAARRRRRGSFVSRNLSALLALGLFAAVSLWMLSGQIIVGGSESKTPPLMDAASEKQEPQKLFRVAARSFRADRRNEILHIRSRTEADKSVEVRAETAGRVEAISGMKGRFVAKGTLLCKLDEGSRKATLAGARSQVAQTRADYEAASKLSRSGYAADLNVSAKRAALEAATASLEQAELDLAHTAIKAPFDGVIDEQPAKIGDFLAVGGSCAKLVALDPLLVVGDVSERDIASLKTGQKGRAELVTGEKVEGRIRYIAPSAATATRTFRVELEVPNRDNAMRNGVTADVHVPLEPISGHHVSAGLLTLNDAGEVGVRTVDADKVVHFMPVRILDQGKDGAFVGGLPDTVAIITVGQDYVTEGQKVEVQTEEGEAALPATTREASGGRS